MKWQGREESRSRCPARIAQIHFRPQKVDQIYRQSRLLLRPARSMERSGLLQVRRAPATISITTSPTLSYIGSPFTYDALATATGYTVTGASGGHQLVLETWTVTLVGGDFNGTITATPGNVLTGTASLTSGSAIVRRVWHGVSHAMRDRCVIQLWYQCLYCREHSK